MQLWLWLLSTLFMVSLIQTMFVWPKVSFKRLSRNLFQNITILLEYPVKKSKFFITCYYNVLQCITIYYNNFLINFLIDFLFYLEPSILFAIWLLSSLILTNSYKGLIFASLTKGDPIYFHSFEEIAAKPQLNPFVINWSWKHMIDNYVNSKMLKSLANRFQNVIVNGSRNFNQAVVRVVTEDIPFIVHEDFNRKWKRMFNALPLATGEEMFFWVVSTRYPISKSSKYKRELYRRLAFFNLNIYFI